MRAVKIEFYVPDDCTTTSSQLHYYINQLRYERLMAKAVIFWRIKSWYMDVKHEVQDDKELYARFILKESQCKSIAEALEARARRIKEGM